MYLVYIKWSSAFCDALNTLPCVSFCRPLLKSCKTLKTLCSYLTNAYIDLGKMRWYLICYIKDFEKQDGCHGSFSTFSKEFCWLSTAKGIIGRDLKFTGYVPHYKILTGNIFGLILKNKMAATGVSLSVMKSPHISLIIDPRGLVCEANL